MSTALREQLQATLGPVYTLGRELGGGGMSRVFVAREEALGRDVVVKLLAPELAADALRLFRASDVAGDGGPAPTWCTTCVLPDLARAAEKAGWADSARVFWTRYAEEPAVNRNEADQWHLARAYRRLGELWAAAGDDAKAMRYDSLFVTLRDRAEPALQPEVAAVRQRLVSRPRQVPAGE